MPSIDEDSDASDAIVPDMLHSASPAPQQLPFQPPDTIDSGDASDAVFTALADDLEYTLTVGQALEHIVAAGRQPLSKRSIQRYCIEHLLAAKKIRTVFGSEWLINETSLARLIESEPIVTGDASDAVGRDVPAPATPIPPTVNLQPLDTTDNGDASVVNRPAMATPEGEKRTIAEVLIENARLLAQVEGRDAIIVELKSPFENGIAVFSRS